MFHGHGTTAALVIASIALAASLIVGIFVPSASDRDLKAAATRMSRVAYGLLAEGRG